MARDYKHRAQDKKTGRGGSHYGSVEQHVGLWKWMLITMLIISFVVFLVYLRTASKQNNTTQQAPQALSSGKPAKNDRKNDKEAKTEKKTEPEHKLPRFDFYTILPDKEVVVPEYEIKTRTREERVGKAKETKYIMQAGSFKAFKEADQLRAKLALMGIESKVEKAKVGNVTWNRVKMGPYTQMTSVNTIKSRLKKNGIDVIVTELGQ